MSLFIDANNLLKRYYHGGEHPYAIWVAQLRRALTQHDSVNVVCDTATSRNYRRAICGKYKEGRDQESDPVFFTIYNDCIDLAAFSSSANVIKVTNGEADDYIIANAVKGDTVWSNDRDLWVLLDKVSIYTQATTKVTPDMLMQKFNAYYPHEVKLYKALVGDPSDNIPGRRGFGPGAWAKLSLKKREEVLKAFEEGKEHALISFEAGKSFELASLCKDIQFEVVENTLTESFTAYITRKGIVC